MISGKKRRHLQHQESKYIYHIKWNILEIS